jgi:hypothetical protein
MYIRGQGDDVPTAVIQDALTGDDEPAAAGGGAYEKYFKMLAMHLPRGAVEQKMIADGVDPSILDNPEAASAPVSNPSPAPASTDERRSESRGSRSSKRSSKTEKSSKSEKSERSSRRSSKMDGDSKSSRRKSSRRESRREKSPSRTSSKEKVKRTEATVEGGAASGAVMEGYVMKRGRDEGTKTKWKSRWCVFDGTRLNFTKKPTDTKSQGMALLSSGCEVVPCSEPGMPNSFKILTNNGSIEVAVLSVPSPEERPPWLECLTAAITKMVNAGGDGPDAVAPDVPDDSTLSVSDIQSQTDLQRSYDLYNETGDRHVDVSQEDRQQGAGGEAVGSRGKRLARGRSFKDSTPEERMKDALKSVRKEEKSSKAKASARPAHGTNGTGGTRGAGYAPSVTSSGTSGVIPGGSTRSSVSADELYETLSRDEETLSKMQDDLQKVEDEKEEVIFKAIQLMDKKMRDKILRGPPPSKNADPASSRWVHRTEKGVDPMLTIHDRKTRKKANDALAHCQAVFESQYGSGSINGIPPNTFSVDGEGNDEGGEKATEPTPEKRTSVQEESKIDISEKRLMYLAFLAGTHAGGVAAKQKAYDDGESTVVSDYRGVRMTPAQAEYRAEQDRGQRTSALQLSKQKSRAVHRNNQKKKQDELNRLQVSRSTVIHLMHGPRTTHHSPLARIERTSHHPTTPPRQFAGPPCPQELLRPWPFAY